MAEEIENKIIATLKEGPDAVIESEEIEIMPEEPTSRPRKKVDIDIAVDED